MKKIVTENFVLIVFVFLIFTFFRSCGTNNKIEKIKEQLEKQETIFISKIDFYNFKTLENLYLELSGLKSEKRMIQSTDRKMMDLNRQKEIDMEIIKLENEISEIKRELKIKYETLD